MPQYDLDSLVRDPDFQGRSFAERKAILREADAEGFGTLPEAAQSRMLVDMKGQEWWTGGKAAAKAPQMTQEDALTAWQSKGKVKPVDTRKVGYTGDSGARASLPSRKQVADFARPALEGTGIALGGIGGAALGAGTGGVTSPLLAVAGGATGYATGKYLADAIEGAPQSAPQTLKDLGTGAMYEMGGQGLAVLGGKAISGGVNTYRAAKSAVSRNTPAVTQSGIQRKAGEILAENSGQSAVYEKNAADTAKVAIPGYKPSLGESRNDPGLIKLQRGIERQPGTAANVILEQKAANQNAVKDYLANEFKGNESIDDVVNALNQKKAQIEATTAQAERGAEAARGGLNPADTQSVGRGVVDTIDEVGAPAKQQVNKLYQDLPNEPLPTSNTATAVKELEKDFRPGDEDVFPSRAIARVKEALQGPKPKVGGHGKPADPVILDAYGKPMRDTVDTTKTQVGFQDLHSLRKDLGRQIQDAMTGAQPNRELAMKLRRIKEAVDADIDAGMGSNTAYADARQAFADYANKFRTGEVAKITQKGGQASGRNIPDALIAKRVFSADGADDFINAVGTEKAATHADQYAAQDLLSKANPLTGEIPAKAVAGWIQKNMLVLRKYGISGKYTTVAKAQAQAELARAAESEFTKSAASRILNADVDKAIGSAFSSNPSNTGAVVDELMKQVGKDKQGIKGLQNAFKDFLVAKVETTAKTISGDAIISPAAIQKELAKYAPAMRRLYANDPGKIAALQKASKAVEIQSRSAKSPIGGGSDTAENLNVARSILGRVVDIIPGGGMVRGLTRAGLGKLHDLNAAELNKVIARALYDPELAKTLMLAASKRVKPAVVEKQLNSHLITMGLAGIDD
jgi:hypothetical protein